MRKDCTADSDLFHSSGFSSGFRLVRYRETVWSRDGTGSLGRDSCHLTRSVHPSHASSIDLPEHGSLGGILLVRRGNPRLCRIGTPESRSHDCLHCLPLQRKTREHGLAGQGKTRLREEEESGASEVTTGTKARVRGNEREPRAGMCAREPELRSCGRAGSHPRLEQFHGSSASYLYGSSAWRCHF